MSSFSATFKAIYGGEIVPQQFTTLQDSKQKSAPKETTNLQKNMDYSMRMKYSFILLQI